MTSSTYKPPPRSPSSSPPATPPRAPSPLPTVEAAVDAFLADATTPAGEVFTTTAELVAAARQWCDERGEYKFGSRALAKALLQRGAQRHSTGHRRGWKGVKLR